MTCAARREATISIPLSVLLLSCLVAFTPQAALAQDAEPFLSLGERRELHSSVLGERREIIVGLPARAPVEPTTPSLWWDGQRLVAQADSAFDHAGDLVGDFYMTMGNEGGAMLGGALKFAGVLEASNSVRFRSGPDAALRYGHRGTYGAVEIETHSGR